MAGDWRNSTAGAHTLEDTFLVVGSASSSAFPETLSRFLGDIVEEFEIC